MFKLFSRTRAAPQNQWRHLISFRRHFLNRPKRQGAYWCSQTNDWVLRLTAGNGEKRVFHRNSPCLLDLRLFFTRTTRTHSILLKVYLEGVFLLHCKRLKSRKTRYGYHNSNYFRNRFFFINTRALYILAAQGYSVKLNHRFFYFFLEFWSKIRYRYLRRTLLPLLLPLLHIGSTAVALVYTYTKDVIRDK